MLAKYGRLAKRSCNIFISLAVTGSCFIANTALQAATLTVLDFSEIAFQPVDDLEHAGVKFDFKIAGVDSSEAFYNSFGPGTLTYVDDPSLTGDSAGVLRLDFAAPTSVLEFGVALNTANELSPGFRVELFSPDLMSLGETSVDVFPTGGALGFSENRFQYSGAPVSRVVVRFDHQPGSFALDNLTFLPVPEPSSLFSGTVALLTFFSRRRRANRNH